jgi:phospholipid/cholesterol/gamma-HCH transport system ATP-binding protein
MEPIIKVEHLNAELGGRTVLKDINLEIYPNRISVVLGGSGSGKTTLLKHLIGLYPVQDGLVEVFNYSLKEIEETEYEKFAREIGVLFQNSALFNSLTVSENLTIPLEQNTSLSQELMQRLITKKLDLVDLREAIQLYPAQLSGGMKKRVALARALAMDPPLLFCDEPSAGLDPVTARSLDNLFLKLKDMLRITIVLVTHEVRTIRRLADRLIFMDDGEIIFAGTLEQALDSEIKKVSEFFKDQKIPE